MPRGRTVNIGIIGAGFLAETRARAYVSVSSASACLAAVASRTLDHAQKYAARHGIADAYDDYRRVLERPDVDVVDLCVPNFLHRRMTEEAAAAGKHVIVAKPLTAFEGPGSAPRAEMLEQASANASAMVSACERAGVYLMYAENWVYAPSIAKAASLAAASGGAILEMRGGECHSGSHSPYSKEWKYTGGGALFRLGVHPLGAMLSLKRAEGMRRTGAPIRPKAVVAEVGDLTKSAGFVNEQRHFVGTGWLDVENWGSLILTFDDGTRGIVWASDAVLGGMESNLQILMSNAHFKCNLSHTGLLSAYAPAPDVFGSEYLTEKLETSAGWSPPQPDEDGAQGHRQMVDDFVGAVAEGRPPLADGALGADVIRVVYSAYVAAEEGRRVEIQ
jgi:predicted dehydrogenase